jgi:TPR repeat protein
MKNIKQWLSNLSDKKMKISDKILRQVNEEIQANKADSALVAKAIAQSAGDRIRAKNLYIQLRAESLIATLETQPQKKLLKPLTFIGVAIVVIAGLVLVIYQRNQPEQAAINTAPETVAKTQIADTQPNISEKFAQAMQLAQQNRSVEALPLLQQLAEQGNAPAQFHLAQMYRDGQGVTQNNDQALIWYRKAAEQGQVEAQNYLGWFYSAAQDYSPAVAWYRKAAEQGYAEAQYNLGWLYAKGRGVAQDDKQAVDWFSKAAQQGYADAQFNLGWMYAKGLGVTRDDGQAIILFGKAAQQGYADAEFNLGLMYAKGLGIAKNDKQAIAWFQKAAQQGQQDALAVLKKLGQ